MITVRFFAQVRELVGCSSLQFNGRVPSVEALRQQLAQRGEQWQRALEPGALLVAVNHSVVAFNHPLVEGDEVAFFPPVTGG